MRFRDCNYYGLNHKKVAEQFKGGLTYLGTFNLIGEYLPSAVYHAANPDRSKGHKEYMLLVVQPTGDGLVRGLEREDLRAHATRNAAYCTACDEVIYSCMRHHSTRCHCAEAMMDGGTDYVRSGVSDKVVYGKLDLIARTFNGQTESPSSEGIKPNRTRKGAKKAPKVQPLQAKPKRKRQAPTKARRKKAAQKE